MMIIHTYSTTFSSRLTCEILYRNSIPVRSLTHRLKLEIPPMFFQTSPLFPESESLSGHHIDSDNSTELTETIIPRAHERRVSRPRASDDERIPGYGVTTLVIWAKVALVEGQSRIHLSSVTLSTSLYLCWMIIDEYWAELWCSR